MSTKYKDFQIEKYLKKKIREKMIQKEMEPKKAAKAAIAMRAIYLVLILSIINITAEHLEDEKKKQLEVIENAAFYMLGKQNESCVINAAMKPTNYFEPEFGKHLQRCLEGEGRLNLNACSYIMFEAMIKKEVEEFTEDQEDQEAIDETDQSDDTDDDLDDDFCSNKFLSYDGKSFGKLSTIQTPYVLKIVGDSSLPSII